MLTLEEGDLETETEELLDGEIDFEMMLLGEVLLEEKLLEGGKLFDGEGEEVFAMLAPGEGDLDMLMSIDGDKSILFGCFSSLE